MGKIRGLKEPFSLQPVHFWYSNLPYRKFQNQLDDDDDDDDKYLAELKHLIATNYGGHTFPVRLFLFQKRNNYIITIYIK